MPTLTLNKPWALEDIALTSLCHGFHSNLLVCGNIDGSIQLFDTQQEILFRQIRLESNTISDISMNRKFIIAGTIRGAVHLKTHTGVNKYSFKTNAYIHSVSISDLTILSATRRQVYRTFIARTTLWSPKLYFRPYCRDSMGLLWSFREGFRQAPFLIGKAGRSPK